MNGGGFNFASMPKAITCYICGRGYGTRSIKIHLKTCKKKWKIEQSKKPRNERRKLPKAPIGFNNLTNNKESTKKEIFEMNNKAFDNYNEQSLECCQFCNRSFNSDAFTRHKRICTADKPFKMLQRKTNPGNSTNIKDKNILTNSNKKPKNSNTQDIIIKKKTEKVDYSNNFENEENVQIELTQCSKCSRSFNPDRISKHTKICKGLTKPKKAKIFHKKITKSEKQKMKKQKLKNSNWKSKHQDFVENMKYIKKINKAQKNGVNLRDLPPPPKSKNDGFLECQYCSRTFNPTAHERHVRSCKNVVNKPRGVGVKKTRRY